MRNKRWRLWVLILALVCIMCNLFTGCDALLQIRDQSSSGDSEDSEESTTKFDEYYLLGIGLVGGELRVSDEMFTLSISEYDSYSKYTEYYSGSTSKDEEGRYIFYPEKAQMEETYFEKVINSKEITTELPLGACFQMEKIKDEIYILTTMDSLGTGSSTSTTMAKSGLTVIAMKKHYRPYGVSHPIYLLSSWECNGQKILYLPLNLSSEELSEVLKEALIAVQCFLDGALTLPILDIEVNVDLSQTGETTMEILYEGNTYTYSCYVYDPQTENLYSSKYKYVYPSNGLASRINIGTTAEDYFADVQWEIYDETGAVVENYTGEYTVLGWDTSKTTVYMIYRVLFEYDGETLYYDGYVTVCPEEDKDKCNYVSRFYFEKAAYTSSSEVVYVKKGTDLNEGIITLDCFTFENENIRDVPCTLNGYNKDLKGPQVVEIVCESLAYSQNIIIYVFDDTNILPVEMEFEGIYIYKEGGTYSIGVNYSEAFVEITYCDGSIKEVSENQTSLYDWFKLNQSRFHWDILGNIYYMQEFGTYGYFYGG